MWTMAASSGRSEGAVGGIVRFIESDGAARKVTTSEVVWAITGRNDRRERSKKRAPQLGGSLKNQRILSKTASKTNICRLSVK